MTGISTAGRWTVAGVIVIAALIVAMLCGVRKTPVGPVVDQPQAAREHRDADTPEELAEPRARAKLMPCPPPRDGAGPGALRGIVLECAGDGSRVPVAEALAGRPVVLNLWAYWCAPCAAELPAMAEVQRLAGDRLTVVTVHEDENEEAALDRLAELGVHLPTLQDGAKRIAAALRVPNVVPSTVLIRSDGSVARVLPRSFTSADEIGVEVGSALGVRF